MFEKTRLNVLIGGLAMFISMIPPVFDKEKKVFHSFSVFLVYNDVSRVGEGALRPCL